MTHLCRGAARVCGSADSLWSVCTVPSALTRPPSSAASSASNAANARRKEPRPFSSTCRLLLLKQHKPRPHLLGNKHLFRTLLLILQLVLLFYFYTKTPHYHMSIKMFWSPTKTHLSICIQNILVKIVAILIWLCNTNKYFVCFWEH